MRKRFGAVVLLMSLCSFFGVTTAQTWSMSEIGIKISKISYSGEVVIKIVNASSRPVRIWNESNSWGAGRWRILAIGDGHLRTFFQNPAQNFTQNAATFREIAPGAEIQETLNPNDDEWCTLGICRNSYPYNQKQSDIPKTTFRPGDLLIVDYDMPAFPESLRYRVWWGVATDSAIVQ